MDLDSKSCHILNHVKSISFLRVVTVIVVTHCLVIFCLLLLLLPASLLLLFLVLFFQSLQEIVVVFLHHGREFGLCIGILLSFDGSTTSCLENFVVFMHHHEDMLNSEDCSQSLIFP